VTNAGNFYLNRAASSAASPWGRFFRRISPAKNSPRAAMRRPLKGSCIYREPLSPRLNCGAWVNRPFIVHLSEYASMRGIFKSRHLTRWLTRSDSRRIKVKHESREGYRIGLLRCRKRVFLTMLIFLLFLLFSLVCFSFFFLSGNNSRFFGGASCSDVSFLFSFFFFDRTFLQFSGIFYVYGEFAFINSHVFPNMHFNQRNAAETYKNIRYPFCLRI